MKLYHGLEQEFTEFRLEKKFPYITGMWFTDTKKNSIIDYYASRSGGKIMEVEVDFDKPVLDLSMYDTDENITERDAEDFLRDCKVYDMGHADDVIDDIFNNYEVKLYNVLLKMFVHSEDSFDDMSHTFSAFKIKENDVLTYFVFDPKKYVTSYNILKESFSKYDAMLYSFIK